MLADAARKPVAMQTMSHTLPLPDAQIESGEIHVQSTACRGALLALLADKGAALQLLPVCPRQKQPVTLIAVGGHDPSWHNIRCAVAEALARLLLPNLPVAV